MNMIVISRSLPSMPARVKPSIAEASAPSSGVMLRSATGRTWQASRNPLTAPMRSSAFASRAPGRRQRLAAAAHLHAAGGAARPPAAHRGVRDAVIAQRLEDAGAREDRQLFADGWSKLRRHATHLHDPPHAARSEDEEQQADVREQDLFRHAVDRRLRFFLDVGVSKDLLGKFLVGLRGAHDLVARGQEA
jgi:hypothetical protein